MGLSALVAVLMALIFAYLFSEISRLFGLPRVVGQITAGLILGVGPVKELLFHNANMDVLSFLANLGIILLFYYVGLETNFKAFTKNVKGSIYISFVNTMLPLIIGFLVSRYFLEFGLLTSLIIGICLSVSAQAVSVALLDELKMLRTRIGNIIISAGAIDDIIELLLITLVLSSFHVAISNVSFPRLLFDIVLFLIVVVISRLWFIPYTLRLFDREKSSTARFMGSLIVVLLIASLSEILGIGSLIGAMVAGIIMRQTIFKDVEIPDWEEHDIARSTHIIAFGFLIPLFFVWVGLNANLGIALQNIPLISTFSIIATVATVGGTIIAVLFGGGKFMEGLIVGWGLNPKGDVELVIAALALKAALITQTIFTSLVFMSLFTTVVSPVIFKALVLKYGKMARK